MLRLTGHIERLLVVLLYGSILLRGLEKVDKVPDELLLLVGHREGVCGIEWENSQEEGMCVEQGRNVD